MTHSVVITGASSGIGKACALHLARAGYHVFASVRTPADGAALQDAGGDAITPVKLDVCIPEQIERAAQFVRDRLPRGGSLIALVNNAGIAIGGPLEILPIAALRRQLEVNTVAPVAVAQAFLPLLRETSGRATIVNMSSVSGRFTVPLLGPYAASKHALEAITDALRLELRPWGIRVVSIEPSNIATPIWDKTLRWGGEMLESIPASTREPYEELIDFVRSSINQDQFLPPERVAEVVAEVIESSNPKARYVVGRKARIFLWISRLPTGLRDWILTRRISRFR